jgi:xylan 1,4-beta-xylosidase
VSAVEFRCDLLETSGPLPHFWEHTVGSGHAPLALRADWQRQLQRCHEELGFQHVRFHGILSDDMGTLVDEQDRLLYSFFNADQILDFLLSIGMKPFIELSFMPRALAAGSKTVFRYRGIVTPPRSYRQWRTLIHKLIEHWVDRYGIEEVRSWFFEIWNEPNLKAFWTRTQSEYFRLYRHTVQAIKEIDDQLRVGGPATAKNEWIAEFLDFCDRHGLPADFVSTHHYPTDALGTEGEDTLTQLAQSQRGKLLELAQDTKRRTRGRPLYYTEWNSSSNPRDSLHDQPYTAAVIVKTMLDANGLAEGYSFWTFSDIFEENYFPAEPFQGGFGLLNIYDLAKPSYRAFELLHRLGDRQLLVDGLHETVDAWVVLRNEAATVMLTNHALPRHAIEAERVRIRLTGAQPSNGAFVERIDEGHANVLAHWREMGEPQYLTQGQKERLQSASELIREPLAIRSEHETIDLELTLPPHSVAAVTVPFASGGFVA